MLTRALAGGMSLQECVEAPRIHPEGELLDCEGGFTEEVLGALELAGEQVVRWPARNLYFGGAQAVAAHPGGRLEAAGDPRRGGDGRGARARSPSPGARVARSDLVGRAHAAVRVGACADRARGAHGLRRPLDEPHDLVEAMRLGARLEQALLDLWTEVDAARDLVREASADLRLGRPLAALGDSTSSR